MKKNAVSKIITEVPISANKDIITDAELNRGEIITEIPAVSQKIIDETVSSAYDIMLAEENTLKMTREEPAPAEKFSAAERKELTVNFSKRTLLSRYGIKL